MDRHKEFLEQVIDMATKNVKDGLGGPFGSLVVKDGKIIGRGVNHVTVSNDPTAHAEIIAIRDACKNLNNFQLDGCIIYSSCEPCPMCLGAIYWARLKMLVFAASQNDAATAGFDDHFIRKEMEMPFEKRSIKTMKITPDTYLAPFKEWIENEKKVEY